MKFIMSNLFTILFRKLACDLHIAYKPMSHNISNIPYTYNCQMLICKHHCTIGILEVFNSLMDNQYIDDWSELKTVNIKIIFPVSTFDEMLVILNVY